jgi:hypothetical protein
MNSIPMTWIPKFWIEREYFDKDKILLSKYDVWEYNIGKSKGVLLTDGVVLTVGQYTSSSIDLHDIFLAKSIPHWILNGENGLCILCKVAWRKYYEIGVKV